MKDFGLFASSGAFLAAIQGRLYDADIPLGGVGVEGSFDDSFWYDFDAEIPKPRALLMLSLGKSVISADGVDVATISGIPAGVSVSLNGDEPVEVMDGEVVFTSLDYGDHSLVFTGIPYLPTEVTIAAV